MIFRGLRPTRPPGSIRPFWTMNRTATAANVDAADGDDDDDDDDDGRRVALS